MKEKDILKGIATFFLIGYGLMGVWGKGPISTTVVLMTYMVIFFAHVYLPSYIDLRIGKEEEKE